MKKKILLEIIIVSIIFTTLLVFSWKFYQIHKLDDREIISRNQYKLMIDYLNQQVTNCMLHKKDFEWGNKCSEGLNYKSSKNIANHLIKKFNLKNPFDKNNKKISKNISKNAFFFYLDSKEEPNKNGTITIFCEKINNQCILMLKPNTNQPTISATIKLNL